MTKGYILINAKTSVTSLFLTLVTLVSGFNHGEVDGHTASVKLYGAYSHQCHQLLNISQDHHLHQCANQDHWRWWKHPLVCGSRTRHQLITNQDILCVLMSICTFYSCSCYIKSSWYFSVWLSGIVDDMTIDLIQGQSFVSHYLQLWT